MLFGDNRSRLALPVTEVFTNLAIFSTRFSFLLFQARVQTLHVLSGEEIEGWAERGGCLDPRATLPVFEGKALGRNDAAYLREGAWRAGRLP